MKLELMEFAAYAHGIQIAGPFGTFLNEQQFVTLERFGSVCREDLKAEVYGDWTLPWYTKGDAGKNAWWDLSADQFTVRRWAAARDEQKQNERVEYFLEHGMPPGPVLAMRDTTTGMTTVLDGCHRLCAHYIRDSFVTALVFETPHAPMLFPPDFLRSSLYMVIS